MRLYFSILVLIGIYSHYAFAKAESSHAYDKECIYVIATSGLNMRDAASAEAKVIEKLPYGTKLEWVAPGSNDVKTYVIDAGKKVAGYWVKVWRSVPYEELENNPSGYVFSAYLGYHLKEIPQRSLYLYNHFSIINHTAGTSFNSSYHIDTDTYNYSAYIDCYPWYDEHYGAHKAQYNGKEYYLSQPADSLKSLLTLELVDYNQVIHLKKKTDYDLDYSFKPTLLPINEKETEHDFLKRYYLPLHSGDSVEIKAHTGEFPHNIAYVGELKKQNKYLIAAQFEGLEYLWVDKITGERDVQAVPKISPNNKYGVHNDTVYYENGAQVSISTLDENIKPIKTLHVNFQSWAVSPGVDDAFWISDNQIILKVHPIDNTIQEVMMDKPIEPHWQYLKLTIL